MKTDKTIWAEIVARSTTDIDFRKELLANPAKVMQEYGIKIPKNVKINLIEQKSEDEVYMVLPKLGSKTLNDDFLKEIGAAASSEEQYLAGEIPFNSSF